MDYVPRMFGSPPPELVMNAALDIPLYDYLRIQGLSDAEISLGYDTNPYHGDSSFKM